MKMKEQQAADKFSKLYIALKFRLKGEKMYDALRALELAKDIHTGFRKDGVTPSFQHQIEIALFIFTLKGLEDLEGAIICALFHDTDEDYPHQIPSGTLESFGPERMKTIRLLNKHTHSSMEECLVALGDDLNGSIVKGCDRINNFQSMRRGKFSLEKIIKYRDEVVKWFMEMLKNARKTFPKQMDAFYGIETMLKFQTEFVDFMIEDNLEIQRLKT